MSGNAEIPHEREKQHRAKPRAKPHTSTFERNPCMRQNHMQLYASNVHWKIYILGTRAFTFRCAKSNLSGVIDFKQYSASGMELCGFACTDFYKVK